MSSAVPFSRRPLPRPLALPRARPPFFPRLPRADSSRAANRSSSEPEPSANTPSCNAWSVGAPPACPACHIVRQHCYIPCREDRGCHPSVPTNCSCSRLLQRHWGRLALLGGGRGLRGQVDEHFRVGRLGYPRHGLRQALGPDLGKALVEAEEGVHGHLRLSGIIVLQGKGHHGQPRARGAASIVFWLHCESDQLQRVS